MKLQNHRRLLRISTASLIVGCLATTSRHSSAQEILISEAYPVGPIVYTHPIENSFPIEVSLPTDASHSIASSQSIVSEIPLYPIAAPLDWATSTSQPANATGSVVQQSLTATVVHNPEIVTQRSIVETRRIDDTRLQATLWMQHSLEYSMLTRQAYRSAQDRLVSYVKDRAALACVEQSSPSQILRDAIILDVDETVLSNIPFQARLIRSRQEFSEDAWTKWCNEAAAEPIAGSVQFIRHARKLGVAVFFVTNRSVDVKDATVKNLSTALGYEVSPDNVLMKKEQPEWTSNKTSRRQVVCESYRVIMLLGDDFNDFFFLGDADPETRLRRGMELSENFGRQWVMLPNSLYGNWDRALFDYDFDKTLNERLDMKYRALELAE